MLVFFLFPSLSSQFSQRHFGKGGVSQYDLKYKENYIKLYNLPKQLYNLPKFYNLPKQPIKCQNPYEKEKTLWV